MSILKKILYTASLSSVFVPMLAFAQYGQNIMGVIDVIAVIANKMVSIAIIFALFWFVYGLWDYIENPKPEDRKKGVERMVMGTISFFVIVSMWGLVRFLQNTFGIAGSSSNLRTDDIPFVGDRR